MANPLPGIVLLPRLTAAILHRPALVPTPVEGTGGSPAPSYPSRPLNTACVPWYVPLISPLTPRLILSPHSFISPLLQPVTRGDLHQRLRSDFQTEENDCQILSASSEALQNMHQCRNSTLEADKNCGFWMQSSPRSANVTQRAFYLRPNCNQKQIKVISLIESDVQAVCGCQRSGGNAGALSLLKFEGRSSCVRCL